MIDPMLSLGCYAVSLVPLVAFWVACSHDSRRVPQDRRRPKMTDHILLILSARDGHGRWSGPDQDHARRSTCLPGGCTALAWPEGAVVSAVMAPAEGKNGKSGSFFPKTGAAAGAFGGFPYHKIRIFFLSFPASQGTRRSSCAVCPESFRGNGQF